MRRPSGKQRTRLEPEQRRELILDAAEDVFAGRDPSEVTFEEVAEAADVSRALVYNYFGDKGGLLAAVYVRVIARLDAALEVSMTNSAEPSDRLRAAITTYVAFARDNAPAWKVIGQAEVMCHPAVEAVRRARYEALTATWGGTPEARVVARGVVGFLEGATLDLVDEPDLASTDAVDLLHRVLWNGLSALVPVA